MPAATLKRHNGLAHVRRLSQYEHFHSEASGAEQSSYATVERTKWSVANEHTEQE